MSGEFDFRGEHTAHAGMLRFIVRILGEYGAGVNYENAKDDAITYASLLLELLFDPGTQLLGKPRVADDAADHAFGYKGRVIDIFLD